ncbi:hypothetical protein [Nocardia barduliensis]|uniref:hypothetical protein n=1 Tax=Nocardia barduliensis TaxID=2736643 RepID=UPI00157240A2|nr:hypothetical protein [Nocardia barduliensis]
MPDADADGRFDLLLCRTIPLVLAPAGVAVGPRVRGVVRAGSGHARIVLSPDATMGSGIAVDYELTPDGGLLDVTGAVDHARFTVAPAVAHLLAAHRDGTRDSHGNTVLAAADSGFDYAGSADSGDQRLFSLFSLLVGGGLPWFADDYTFAGFLYTEADNCRVYIRVTRTDRTYGIDLAVSGSDGRPIGYSYLAQELAPLARSGDLERQPVLDDTDDYCDAVVDLRAWMGPAGSGATTRA